MAIQYAGSSAAGGYFLPTTLSTKLFWEAAKTTKFMQFARRHPGFGASDGQTMNFDKIFEPSENASAAAYRVGEQLETPTVAYTVGQGDVTCYEHTRAIKHTRFLSVTSQFNLDTIERKLVQKDMQYFLDRLICEAYQGTDYKYIPTSTTGGTWDTDGTASTAATYNLNCTHLADIRDTMFGTLHIPPYRNGEYVCIASTKACRGLKNDPDFEDWAKHNYPNKFSNSEIGRIEQIRVIEENHLLSNAKGTNSVLGEAIVFGEDPVVYVVAAAPRIQRETKDFQRQTGLAWNFIGGITKAWDYSTDGEERIVHVTSS